MIMISSNELLHNPCDTTPHVLTEFLKTVQIYFKRYPTCIWSLKGVVIVHQVSLDHHESTLLVITQEKWLLKQLNRSGTLTGKQPDSTDGLCYINRALAGNRSALAAIVEMFFNYNKRTHIIYNWIITSCLALPRDKYD